MSIPWPMLAILAFSAGAMVLASLSERRRAARRRLAMSGGATFGRLRVPEPARPGYLARAIAALRPAPRGAGATGPDGAARDARDA